MRIQIVTPSPGGSVNGNRVTARRVAGLLRGLGHGVRVKDAYEGGDPDVLVALHARRSHPSIRRFRREHPDRSSIVVLTGTDLYRNLQTSRRTRESLEWSTRLVVLQRRALQELPKEFRNKARTIYQSAAPWKGTARPPRGAFQVCVVCNLRPLKDPLRTALAARRLPPSSRIRVVHVGTALTKSLHRRAAAETQRNVRYRWLGGLSYGRTRRILLESQLVSITSQVEGSSNVLSEALVSAVPVVASKIPGLIGTLGEDYPGFFPVGDTTALAGLLERVETDAGFYRFLKEACRTVSHLVQPERERACWKALLEELV